MNRKSAIVILSSLIVLTCIVYILFFSFRIQKLSVVSGEDKNPYEYRILVCDSVYNRDFMESFFKGIKYVSSSYGGIAEYLEPEVQDENFTVDRWFEYARFADADGMIIFSADESFSARRIENVRGKEIPVVVAGECKAGSYQVSHVTASKYELGKLAAEEIRNGGWKKPVAFVHPTMDFNNTHRIISGINKELENLQNIQVFRFMSKDVADDEIRGTLINLAENNSGDVILCFSEEETNVTAQTIVDLNLTDKLCVIGIFGNGKTMELLKKGIVSAVINIDPWEFGVACGEELFSWKKNGFANQFRQINPRLHKGGEQ